MRPSKKFVKLALSVLGLSAMLSTVTLVGSNATAGAATPQAASVVHTYNDLGSNLGPLVGVPSAVASDGTHVWVVNNAFGFPCDTPGPSVYCNDPGSVTELNASDGTVVQTITVGQNPSAIAVDGAHVWIFNSGYYGDWSGPYITELNASDGSFAQTIDLRGHGVGGGGGSGGSIASNGTDVWVDTGSGGGGIGPGGWGSNAIEIDAATGAIVGQIFQPEGSGPLTINGSTLWIAYSANPGQGLNGYLQEYNSATGAVIGTFSLTSLYDDWNFSERGWYNSSMVGISADNNHVWISHGNTQVAELNTSDGAFVREINLSSTWMSQFNCGAPAPSQLKSTGTYVWVADGCNGVSQIDASSGALITHLQTSSGNSGVSWDGTHVWAIAGNYYNPPAALTEIDPGNQQAMSMGAPPSTEGVGGPTYTPSVIRGASSSPVVITSDSASSGCTVSGGIVSFVSVGICVIDANQAGDANFAAAPQVQQSINVLLSPTQLAIANLPTNAALFGAFTASVSTDSNGVTSVASSTPSVCTVDSSNNVSFVGIGTCTLTSSVAQSATYVAGSGMPQSFAVALATPTGPTISNIPTSTPVGQSFTPLVSTNSDGATSVASTTPRACTIDSGGVAHFIRHGLCTLRTSVTATASYQAQIGASQSFEVQIVPIIRWVKPLSIPYGTALSAAQLNAKSSVPGIFTYTPDFGTVLNGGVQALSANFTPTDTTNYVGGTVTTTVKVKAAWSHTELTVTNPTAAYGSESSTVFGVTVTGPAGAPIVGTVNVKVGWSSGCTITLSSSGTGTCSLGDGQLKRGNYAVMALFVRNGNQVGSHSTVTNIVITP